jgi:glycosyltransferase involved in cell wall biosynthesis
MRRISKIFKPISEEQRLAWRRENGLNPDDVVLIFAGSEWVRKLDLAIRALALVQDPKAKLFIAGDDPAKETLRALADECRWGSCRLWRLRKGCAAALASSDIFSFPSWA